MTSQTLYVDGFACVAHAERTAELSSTRSFRCLTTGLMELHNTHHKDWFYTEEGALSTSFLFFYCNRLGLHRFWKNSHAILIRSTRSTNCHKNIFCCFIFDHFFLESARK